MSAAHTLQQHPAVGVCSTLRPIYLFYKQKIKVTFFFPDTNGADISSWIDGQETPPYYADLFYLC